MDRRDFQKIEKRLLVTSLVFSGICLVVGLAMLKLGSGYLIGVAAGTVAMLLNFHILGYVVEAFLIKEEKGKAIVLYVLRVAIYAIVCIAGFMIGKNVVLIGMVLGIMGIVPGVLMRIGKGGEQV